MEKKRLKNQSGGYFLSPTYLRREKTTNPMKRALSLIAILATIVVSCQNSTDPEKLREQVLASSEFAALVEAYENRGVDLLNEMQSLQGESDEKEQETKKIMEERNRQIRALLNGEEKLSKEEYEAAVSQIDESLGTTPEMFLPARTERMKAAMAALMKKFPEIGEQKASFVQDCLSAYKERKPGK